MHEEERNDGLSREEEEAFRLLAEERRYSRKDEDRIVRELAGRGLVHRASRLLIRRTARLAVAAALLLGTFYLGAEYGGRGPDDPPPLAAPASSTDEPRIDVVLGRFLSDPEPMLDEYRDEPDRPTWNDLDSPKILGR